MLPLSEEQLATKLAYEKAIATVQWNNTTIRVQTPVLQQWPWENGIPLEHGLMAEKLRQQLEHSHHADDIVEIVLVCCNNYLVSFCKFSTMQKFTSGLDAFDNEEAFVCDEQMFVWEYFGGSTGIPRNSDTRTAILDLAHWKCASTKPLNFAVHVLLRYQLMDIMANVLGAPRHGCLSVAGKLPSPNLPDHLLKVRLISAVAILFALIINEQVMNSLSNWTAVLSKFKATSLKSKESEFVGPTWRCTSAQPHQLIHSGATNLVRAKDHTTAS